MTNIDIYKYVTPYQVKHFIPTFLYIKKHSITGMLYFGQTTKDPEKYLGSGIYWTRHLKLHGKEHVETIWYCLFTDVITCVETAIAFSSINNIDTSDDWANLIPESGVGFVHNGYTKGLVAESNHTREITEIQRVKMSRSQEGIVRARDENGVVHTVSREEYAKSPNLKSNRSGKVSRVNRNTGEKKDFNVDALYDMDVWLSKAQTGWYHTPYGRNRTMTTKTLYPFQQWCKTPEKVVTYQAISASGGKIDISMLGKTHRELGYWYEPL